MKDTFTRKEVLWLIKRQIKKCATAVGRMDYRADDLDILRKLYRMKPVSLSEIKNMKK